MFSGVYSCPCGQCVRSADGGNVTTPFFVFLVSRIIARVHTLAFSTFSSIFTDKQIRTAQWMPTFAMNLLSIFSLNAYTSQHIFSGCNRLNVQRIATRRITTQVIAMQFWWNNFYKQLIDKTINSIMYALLHNTAIPIGIQFTLPPPTRFAPVKMFRRDLDIGKYVGQHFCIGKQTIQLFFVPLFFRALKFFNVTQAFLVFQFTIRVPQLFCRGLINAKLTIMGFAITGVNIAMEIRERLIVLQSGQNFSTMVSSILFKVPF